MTHDNDRSEIDPALLETELSADTLNALKQHLQAQQTTNTIESTSNTDIVTENFGLSQFWYTDETAQKFVNEIYRIAINNKLTCVNVAIVSAPSIFYALNKYMQSEQCNKSITINAILLEYDKRFATQFPTQYYYYDYNEPTDLPQKLYNQYDIVIVDPPYITESCMSNIGITMQLLACIDRPTYLIYNTGIVLRQAIYDILQLKCCNYQPKHRVGLMNEFATYTNYESQNLGNWRTD